MGAMSSFVLCCPAKYRMSAHEHDMNGILQLICDTYSSVICTYIHTRRRDCKRLPSGSPTACLSLSPMAALKVLVLTFGYH